MWQPSCKSPSGTFLTLFFLIGKSHFYICITVLRCNLSYQFTYNRISSFQILASCDSDQSLLGKIQTDWYIVQIMIFLFYHSCCQCQLLLCQLKSLLRYLNIHLKWNLTLSQSVMQKISVFTVSVPHTVLTLKLSRYTFFCRRIHLFKSFNIVFIFFSYLRFTLLQILSIFTQDLASVSYSQTSVMYNIVHRPYRAYSKRTDSRKHTGVHKYFYRHSRKPGTCNRGNTT